MMIRRLLMLAGLAAALAGSAVVARTLATPSALVPAIDRAEDLEQLRRWLALEQSFNAEARAAAETLLAEYERDAARYTDAEFYMAVRRLVGLAENGHSNVSSGPVFSQFGLLPLRTYWFSDGLYVVRAHRDHATLLGARITAIDGMPLAELEPRLMEYHGGHRAAFRRFAALPLMLSPAVLHAVGLAARPDELSLDLVRNDGSTFTATVAVEEAPARVRSPSAWRLLLAAPLRGEADDWLTVRDREAILPLYFRDGGQRFRYLHLEGDIAYIQLRANIGGQGNTLRDFTDGVRRRLDEAPPRAIILDNRHNGGGDLTRSADFALALPDLVRDGGRVYVLTDHATFSAGIYTSFFPKYSNPERTVILGEHVGDFTRFWAESRGGASLPDSGIRIGSSRQMHDIGDGCHDASICHLVRSPRWNISVGSLEPDIVVGTTFADFAAGLDPVLERALREISALP